MNKRGTQLLLEQIIKLIIALIGIVIILYAGFVLFRTYFGKQDDMQAQGTLEYLVEKLNNLEQGSIFNYTLQSPVGWYIISFDREHNFNGNFQKPPMIQPNLVCLCKKKCETKFCSALSLPLKTDNELTSIQIQIKDVWLINKGDYYEITTKEPEIEP